MRSLLGGVGSLLLTLGTLGVYAGFAASRQKFLLVSDMFQHWPLAGSLTFGVGNSMMGLALFDRQKNLLSVPTCMASAWAVVGSSEYYGQQWIRVAHFLATALFLWTSYLVFSSVTDGGGRNGILSAMLTFFSLLGVLSGFCLVASREGGDAYWLWRQTLAASEVALLATYFVGYVDVFFIS